MQAGWKRRVGTAALSLLMAAVLLVGGYAWMLTQALGSKALRVHASPDGRHRLVTMDNGFIDAALAAYPMVGRWTYREQDNGFLSYHDQWAVGDIEIAWSEGEALVTMQKFGYPNEGSNPEGFIRVVFDAPAQ